MISNGGNKMSNLQDVEKEMAIVKIKKIAIEALIRFEQQKENSIFQKVLDMIEDHAKKK